LMKDLFFSLSSSPNTASRMLCPLIEGLFG
jgi:hypothetical protein